LAPPRWRQTQLKKAIKERDEQLAALLTEINELKEKKKPVVSPVEVSNGENIEIPRGVEKIKIKSAGSDVPAKKASPESVKPDPVPVKKRREEPG
jgi:SMC interacting uncharacterized protein involved in chromosome segregation